MALAKTFAAAVTTLGMAAGLAGCVDATIDLEVESRTAGKATTTLAMNADVYTLVKMNEERADDDPRKQEPFCADGELNETDDGGADCVFVEEGRFSQLTLGNEPGILDVTYVSPDLVRIALPLSEMQADLQTQEDDQSNAVAEAFFSGHSITFRISGGEITDTNMELSEDGSSAEQQVQFMDLINGTGDLPDELFAIVRAP
jgi:hypothetical protein